MKYLKAFFDYNRNISRRFTPDHIHESNVFAAYRKIGTIMLSHPKVSRVMDIGAGRAWQFPTYYKKWYGVYLIGVDIDGNEMILNAALDSRIVCDVVDDIPEPDGSVDLVMVHSGIEHFQNNERFLQNVLRVLRPGGFLLAQFPSRYASFAVANRLLPGWLKQRLLHVSRDNHEELGFNAYYDRTDYRSFRALTGGTGFKEVYYLPGYFSSPYFEFFCPLYVISYILDGVKYALGMPRLAAYNLFLLQKPPQQADLEPLHLYAWK